MPIEDFQIKYINSEELIQDGILQEVNRQFLHPIGLALEAVESWHGSGVFTFHIQDHREDPAGIIFQEVDHDKVVKFSEMAIERYRQRIKELGYIVQPSTV